MVVVVLVDVVVGSGGGGMDGCSCSGGGRNIIPDMYDIYKFIFSIKVYIKQVYLSLYNTMLMINANTITHSM